MNWEKYGYVAASRYRQKVLKLLKENPKTPKQLSGETNLHLSHVSATLSELIEKGLVKCLTPNLRRGKIFSLTEEGTEIAKELLKSQAR